MNQFSQSNIENYTFLPHKDLIFVIVPVEIFYTNLEYQSTINQRVSSKNFENYLFLHITTFKNRVLFGERSENWTDSKHFQ